MPLSRHPFGGMARIALLLSVLDFEEPPVPWTPSRVSWPRVGHERKGLVRLVCVIRAVLPLGRSPWFCHRTCLLQLAGSPRRGKNKLGWSSAPSLSPCPRCHPPLASHSLAVLRQVIRRQITGAAQTCPLSAVWVFTSAGKFKGWWGVLLSFMCCDETGLELRRLKRAKAFFIVLFFSSKASHSFFFPFVAVSFPAPQVKV